MQFILLLLQILPFLPGLVRAVESIHGSKPGQGVSKLDSAVNLVQTVVPAVAQHLAAEPANVSKLQSLIGAIVAGLNASGNWNPEAPLEQSTKQVGSTGPGGGA